MKWFLEYRVQLAGQFKRFRNNFSVDIEPAGLAGVVHYQIRLI
jgi:hypothetical protein